MTGQPVLVAAMGAHHWPQVRSIYAAGIATGHATFETRPPNWEAFDTAKLPDQRLVAVNPEGQVQGWVAASKVSDRDVYAGVVEHSLYVDPAAQGQGVGRLLLDGPPPPKLPRSGPSSPASFPRMSRACDCTRRPASRWSASAEG